MKRSPLLCLFLGFVGSPLNLASNLKIKTSNRVIRAMPEEEEEEDRDILEVHREDSPKDDNKDQAWKSYNLLSLGCTIFFVGFSDHANHRNGQMAVVSVGTGPF